MELVLERFCYSETETEGTLWINASEYLYTLERPWRPGPAGGVPFESCVPDGSYALLPHTRPDGTRVLALRNPDNGVFYTREERGTREGRYLILFHVGNYVEDVVGCIAPGLVRTIAGNRRMVRSSREAMARLMARKPSSLIIESALGTGV